MKRTKSFACAMVVATLALGSAEAKLIVGFEASEGYTANSAIGPNGWLGSSINQNWYIRVSNPPASEPAFEGTQSLRIVENLASYAAQKVEMASPTLGYNAFSYSFTQRNGSYRNGGNTSWVYIWLADPTSDNGRRSFQITTGYTSTEDGPYRITSTRNAAGAPSSVAINVPQVSLDYADWNTIQVQFDFNAGTYDLLLNDTAVATDLLLPTTWAPTAVIGTWLVSAHTGTTYYDNITLESIPEPGSVAMLGSVGLLGLIWRLRLRMAV